MTQRRRDAATNSGIFDLCTANFQVTGSGSAYFRYVNEELSDRMACNIWVTNPCMPYSSHVCPFPPPPGGYLTLASTGQVTVP